MNRISRQMLILATVAAALGCQSDSKQSAGVPAPPKPRKVYSAPVYQTGSLIPINRGPSSAGDVRSYSGTNKAPVQIDTQRLNSGGPAGVRGN